VWIYERHRSKLMKIYLKFTSTILEKKMLYTVMTETRKQKILIWKDIARAYGKKLKEWRDVNNGSHDDFISNITKEIQIYRWEAVPKIFQVLVRISFNPCEFWASGNLNIISVSAAFARCIDVSCTSHLFSAHNSYSIFFY